LFFFHFFISQTHALRDTVKTGNLAYDYYSTHVKKHCEQCITTFKNEFNVKDEYEILKALEKKYIFMN
jgi:hypothetical protein